MLPRLEAVLLFSLLGTSFAFPAYESLAGRSELEINDFISRSDPAFLRGALPSPPPLKDTSTKLVNDAKHPYKAPGPNDIRGPCPGLNTLASHGYLNRNGIVTPQEVVKAAQEGFNMGNDLAVLVTWGAFLVDGNHLTNLMSIGHKSPRTGIDPPAPAIVGGLNTHGVFEGDASTTRGDAYFGDNFSFNETLFDQLVSLSNQFGAGKYNLSVAAEVRWNRIQDSIARNPTFEFTTPRIFTAFGESIFPYEFFVDGRLNNSQLDLDVARGFFQHNTYPKGFWRRDGALSLNSNALGDGIDALYAAHPIQAGHNEGVGNYVLDPEDAGLFGGLCKLYVKHVNVTVRSLYPNPKGALRTALKANLATFYKGVNDTSCEQIYPYGK